MLFTLYKIGIFLALTTPLKTGYAIARFVSTLYRFASFRDSRAVMDNLQAIFPGRDIASLKRIRNSVFFNFGKYLVDFFRFSVIDKDYIDRYVTVEGRHYLGQELKKGKGVILTSAHIGNWELGGIALSAIGVPLDVVALIHKHENIDTFFNRQRNIKGVKVIPVGAAVRRCFKSLSENRAVALLSDRDYFNNGFEVDFFGKKTIIPKGPALFSRKRQCSILPIFMLRNADDTFTLKIMKPILPVATHNEHEDLIKVTNDVVRVMEDVIRRHPEQWFVFRRYWQRIAWGAE
ncbi:MAG: lysophospholipid acyltransferase family protein [Candidatus Omnitrophota bacterium]|jgi:KDO2-lipid IV(A) lauroyltransferase